MLVVVVMGWVWWFNGCGGGSGGEEGERAINVSCSGNGVGVVVGLEERKAREL